MCYTRIYLQSFIIKLSFASHRGSTKSEYPPLSYDLIEAEKPKAATKKQNETKKKSSRALSLVDFDGWLTILRHISLPLVIFVGLIHSVADSTSDALD